MGLQLNETFIGGSSILSCLCIDILLLLCLQPGPAGVSLFCYCSEGLQLGECNGGVCASMCAVCVVHRVCSVVFDVTSLIEGH